MRYVQVVSGEDTYFFHTMEEAFVFQSTHP